MRCVINSDIYWLREICKYYVDVESVYARNFWKVVIDEINIYPLIPVIYWFRIREKTF